MRQAIHEIVAALSVLGKNPWSDDFKVSDEFLPAVFQTYFQILKNDNRLNKSDFHQLADFVEIDEIDPEVVGVLDLIVEQHGLAKPVT